MTAYPDPAAQRRAQSRANAPVDVTTPDPFIAFVPGTPEPQGSTRAFVNKRTGRAIVTSDNKDLKSWRVDMATAFHAALGTGDKPRFTGPVEVSATFRMPRTKSMPKTKEKPHTVKPDLDKLTRAACDALTQGRVIADDALIVAYGRLEKRYALSGEMAGVEVEVKAI